MNPTELQHSLRECFLEADAIPEECRIHARSTSARSCSVARCRSGGPDHTHTVFIRCAPAPPTAPSPGQAGRLPGDRHRGADAAIEGRLQDTTTAAARPPMSVAERIACVENFATSWRAEIVNLIS